MLKCQNKQNIEIVKKYIYNQLLKLFKNGRNLCKDKKNKL